MFSEELQNKVIDLVLLWHQAKNPLWVVTVTCFCKTVLSSAKQMQLSREFFNSQNLHQFFGVILRSGQKTAGNFCMSFKCEVPVDNSKRGIKE